MNYKKIKILIIDDHKLFTEGLKTLFSCYQQFKIIGTALDGKKGLDVLKKSTPDFILLDIEMPNMNGFDVLKIVTKKYPKIKIIILSFHLDSSFYKKAINLGANAYVPKDAGFNLLLQIINKINKKQNCIKLSEKIMTKILKNKFPRPIHLSEKEWSILHLIQLPTKEIAYILKISKRSVEFHITNIYRKTKLKTRAELALLFEREKTKETPRL